MKKIEFSKVCLTVFAALALTAPAVFASRDEVGTSAAAFLKIGAGARPSAMADAFTASADDVNSLFHNPAGLASVGDFEFTAQYGTHFQSISYNVLGAAHSLGEAGTLGIGVVNLAVSDIPRRTEDTMNAIENFAAGDYAYVAGYARKIAPRVSAGFTAKYLYSKIDTSAASAAAADVGAIAEPVDGLPLSVGVAAQNIGGGMRFEGSSADADPLPLVYKIGFCWRFPGDGLRAALDVSAPRDNSSRIAAAVEYSHRIDDNFSASARAGYKTLADEKLEGLAGLSGGAGIAFRGFRFDFAWLPYGVLGDTFRYALSVKF